MKAKNNFVILEQVFEDIVVGAPKPIDGVGIDITDRKKYYFRKAEVITKNNKQYYIVDKIDLMVEDSDDTNS